MRLIPIIICSILFSCSTAKVGYAPAKITLSKGKVHIQAKEKFKQLPDTTIDAVIIRRLK
jgi:hypothetical protein